MGSLIATTAPKRPTEEAAFGTTKAGSLVMIKPCLSIRRSRLNFSSQLEFVMGMVTASVAQRPAGEAGGMDSAIPMPRFISDAADEMANAAECSHLPPISCWSALEKASLAELD